MNRQFSFASILKSLSLLIIVVALAYSSNVHAQCCNFINSGQNLDTLPTFGVALGDIDGDGDIDAFTVEAYQNLKVFKNNGSGSYTLNQTITPASGEQDNFGVYLKDVDNDNDLDAIVIPFYNSAGLKIYKNNGVGGFTLFQTVSSNLGCHYAGVEDLDGDGDLDVIMAGWMSSNVSVFKNNGVGYFTQFSFLTLINFGSSNDIAVGDVDGDGDQDAVVVSSSQGGRVLINNGSGTFTDNGVTLGNTNDNYYTVAAGDMDKDGTVDLVFGGMYAPLTVLKNSGGGTFSVFAVYASGNYDKHMKLVDYDYDGDPDVFVSSYGSHGLEVWRNDGEGNLSLCYENLNPMPETYSHGFDVGLIDNDQYYDTFMGEFGSDGDKVFFGDPTFYVIPQAASICPGEIYIFPDTTTSSTAVIHTSQLSSIQGCDSNIITTLTVIAVDTAVATTQYILTAAASGAIYQWLNCSTGYSWINGETSQSFQPTASGTYAVRVTQNGCSDTSGCYTILGTGLTENLAGLAHIFPNPVTDVLRIEPDQDLGPVFLSVYDIYGRLLLNAKPVLNTSYSMDLSQLTSGVYFLTIQSASRQHARYKVIKE